MRRNTMEVLTRQGNGDIIRSQARWEGKKRDFLFDKFKDTLGPETIARIFLDCGGEFRLAMTTAKETLRRLEARQTELKL